MNRYKQKQIIITTNANVVNINGLEIIKDFGT